MRPVGAPAGVRTGTGYRFALLMVVVTASSITMLDIVLADRGKALQGAVSCMLAAGFDPARSDLDNLLAVMGRPEVLRTCFAGTAEAPYRGLLATLVVLTVAGLTYWWLPKARDRWRRTLPVEDVDADGTLRAELDALRERTGTRAVLRFRVDPARMTSGAAVHGRTGTYTVCLHAGLLARRGTDPDGFRAVVLHELAHVAHRDVDHAYASTALWRVFVLLALVPSFFQTGRAVVLALSGTVDSPFWPAAASVLLYPVLAGLLLVGLVHLARADLLRKRELHADLQAVAWGAHRAAWDRPDPPGTVVPWLHRGTALLRTHPGWAERRRVLADASGLFRVGRLEMFLTGTAASLLYYELGPVFGRFGPSVPAWITTALVAPVLCLALGLAVVRASRTAGGGAVSGVPAGLWLGCGLLVGEYVNSGRHRVDWLLPRPELLLVFLLIAAVPAVWWSQSVRLALDLPHRGRRRVAVALCALVTTVALWGGLQWWYLGGQRLAMGAGDPNGALRRFFVTTVAGPWRDYAADLSLLTDGLALLTPVHRNVVLGAAALLMWLLPLLLRRGGTGLRARRTLWAGLAGGLVSWAGLALTAYALNAQRPGTLKERLGAFQVVQTWWLIVTVLAACLLTAALVAALARRHWLLRALLAAQVAQLIAYLGVFWLTAADGCLGRLDVIGGACAWRPANGLVLSGKVVLLTQVNAVLGAACAALAGAGAAAALRRLRKRRPKPPTRTAPTRTAPATDLPAPTGPTPTDPVPAHSVRTHSVPAHSARWTAVTALALGVPALLLTVLPLTRAGTSLVSASDPRELTGQIDHPPAAQTAKTRQWQAASWLNKGGLAHGRHLNAAVLALNRELLKVAGQKRNKDGTVPLDETIFRRACGTLGKRVDAARDYFPVPAEDLQRTWSQALHQLSRGTHGCQEAMATGKNAPPRTNAERAALFQSSLTDITQAMTPLRHTFENVTKMATPPKG